jgi:4'-phosphopantetheinyl transferase
MLKYRFTSSPLKSAPPVRRTPAESSYWTGTGGIGVDIERIRPVTAWREIAARYFSKREHEALCSLSNDRALEAFFRGWTRKEAYGKALGQGVSQFWTQFSVSLAPGAATELPIAGSEAGGEGRFTLCPLEPGPGYVAAVAAQGVGWHLRCVQWQVNPSR